MRSPQVLPFGKDLGWANPVTRNPLTVTGCASIPLNLNIMTPKINKDQWKSILQFIVTVLTAILGSMGLQSCL